MIINWLEIMHLVDDGDTYWVDACWDLYDDDLFNNPECDEEDIQRYYRKLAKHSSILRKGIARNWHILKDSKFAVELAAGFEHP